MNRREGQGKFQAKKWKLMPHLDVIMDWNQNIFLIIINRQGWMSLQ